MTKLFEKLLTYTMQQLMAFSVVAGMIYYFVLFNDGSAERIQIETLNTQLAEEETKKIETEKVLAEERRMRDAIGLLSQQYQDLSRRIPKKLDSIELNRNIDSFARNSGVSIKSRRPESLVQKEIIEEVPVSIALEGGFGELATFVYLVSSSERVSSMKNFSITASEERRSAPLKLEGTVVGYQLYENKTERPSGGTGDDGGDGGGGGGGE